MLVAATLAKYATAYVAAALSAFVAAALFHASEYITILLPLLIVALAGLFTFRSNVTKIYREAYEAKDEQVKLAQQQLAQTQTLLAAADAEAATLRQQLQLAQAQTDLTPVVELLDTQELRHQQQLAILQLIADRLGPDPNGGMT